MMFEAIDGGGHSDGWCGEYTTHVAALHIASMVPAVVVVT
jgi:hypothetical protein